MVDAWARSQKVSVHGWAFGVHDGLLQNLQQAVSSPDELARFMARRLTASGTCGGHAARPWSRSRHSRAQAKYPAMYLYHPDSRIAYDIAKAMIHGSNRHDQLCRSGSAPVMAFKRFFFVGRFATAVWRPAWHALLLSGCLGAPFLQLSARAEGAVVTTTPVVRVKTTADGSIGAIRALRGLLLRADPRDEWPLRTVLSGLNVDRFSTSVEVRDFAALHSQPPPHGVEPVEWETIRNTFGAAKTEDGSGEADVSLLTLRDMDEDGTRELEVRSYVGGTGLFTEVTFWKRASGKNRFEMVNGAGYTINGRGSDQDAQWIRLNGRVWLAYRDGDYFGDIVTLARGLEGGQKAPPSLRLQYTHINTFSRVAASGVEDPTRAQSAAWRAVHPALAAAIKRRLAVIEKLEAAGRDLGRFPGDALCIDEHSPLRGAGHYTFDTVFDFSVRHAGDCYEASLISFRNSYLNSHTAATLWIYKAAAQENDEVIGEKVADLPLVTHRRLHRLTWQAAAKALPNAAP